MTEVGRRPTLNEIREALQAICSIKADVDALESDSETFRVILTFQRVQCPQDWIDGQPKPTWLFEQIIEELCAWERQQAREEQWVSKEEQFGSSIEGLMIHWSEKLKAVAATIPETMVTRMEKRILANTVVRLKELKERREAGGVYSQTESRRGKARKTWAEDEYEALKREEEQRKQQAWGDGFLGAGFSNQYSNFYKIYEDLLYDRFRQPPAPKPQPGNKRRWHEILSVPASATKDEIKKAHRKLAMQFHPDRYKEADGHARMSEINTARDEGLGGL
jgi:hypothetical protein